MNNIYKTYRPPGFGTVGIYLIVDNPNVMIQFLMKALHAIEQHCTLDENDGSIRNCILQIGSSSLMVAPSTDMLKHSPSSFYLYVSDVDAMYAHSLENGASSVFPPDDMPYGDRQAGIKDPLGNYWWISQRLKEEPYS